MEKYIAIVICVFLVVTFGSIVIADYQKNQCRLEALKAGKSGDEIAQICK